MLTCGVFAMSGGLVGQEAKKDDKQEAKKLDPAVKVKGSLPPNWGKLGLSDDQKQSIYKIQGKYGEELDKLDAKIRELKAARDKEMRALLTAEQKKRYEELLLSKSK
jgi:hypothetical protein